MFVWSKEYFPKNGVAKLVLLRKGTKPLDNPSFYRPICLLNTVRKLFERIIKRRLENISRRPTALVINNMGLEKGDLQWTH